MCNIRVVPTEVSSDRLSYLVTGLLGAQGGEGAGQPVLSHCCPQLQGPSLSSHQCELEPFQLAIDSGFSLQPTQKRKLRIQHRE